MKINFNAVIVFLSGRKTTVATILGALITFSLGREYIQDDLANLLSVILVALGFTANIATNRYYKKKNAAP